MKYRDLLKLLKNDGWFDVRQSGSHIIMKHDAKPNQIVVPFHSGKEVPKGTLQSILKDADIKTNKR